MVVMVTINWAFDVLHTSFSFDIANNATFFTYTCHTENFTISSQGGVATLCQSSEKVISMTCLLPGLSHQANWRSWLVSPDKLWWEQICHTEVIMKSVARDNWPLLSMSGWVRANKAVLHRRGMMVIPLSILPKPLLRWNWRRRSMLWKISGRLRISDMEAENRGKIVWLGCLEMSHTPDRGWIKELKRMRSGCGHVEKPQPTVYPLSNSWAVFGINHLLIFLFSVSCPIRISYPLSYSSA